MLNAAIALAQGFTSLRCERSRRPTRPGLRPASTPNMDSNHPDDRSPQPLSAPRPRSCRPVPGAAARAGVRSVIEGSAPSPAPDSKPAAISGTRESSARSDPWLPPPAWHAAGVRELVPQHGRDDHVAGGGTGQDALDSLRARRHRGRDRADRGRPPRPSGCRAHLLLAAPRRNRSSPPSRRTANHCPLRRHDDVAGGVAGKTVADLARGQPACGQQVGHRNPVAGRDREVTLVGIGVAARAEAARGPRLVRWRPRRAPRSSGSGRRRPRCA